MSDRILSRGKYVRIGLATSVLFNFFLVQLGQGSPQAGWKADVLVNRLPNLLFRPSAAPAFLGAFRQESPRASWRSALQVSA